MLLGRRAEWSHGQGQSMSKTVAMKMGSKGEDCRCQGHLIDSRIAPESRNRYFSVRD